MGVRRIPFETLLAAACLFHALTASPAFAFLVHTSQRARLTVVEATKDSLFELLEQAPKNNPTSQRLTADILRKVRLLENECPTRDEEVIQALAGKSSYRFFD